MTELPHATLSDFVAWNTPLTIREIVENEGTWGVLPVSGGAAPFPILAHDKDGRLWLDGNEKPQPEFIDVKLGPNSFVMFHHQGGIAIHVPKRSYQSIYEISAERLERGAGRYIPVNYVVAADEIPAAAYLRQVKPKKPTHIPTP